MSYGMSDGADDLLDLITNLPYFLIWNGANAWMLNEQIYTSWRCPIFLFFFFLFIFSFQSLALPLVSFSIHEYMTLLFCF